MWTAVSRERWESRGTAEVQRETASTVINYLNAIACTCCLTDLVHKKKSEGQQKKKHSAVSVKHIGEILMSSHKLYGICEILNDFLN